MKTLTLMNDVQVLREITDDISYAILRSTIDGSKTVSQLCLENNTPPSSTYKKIKRLRRLGLLGVERIDIDEKGRKLILYRSMIDSAEISLTKDGISLEFRKNGT